MARKKKTTTAKVNVRAVWAKLEPEQWLDVVTRAGLNNARVSGAGIKARCHKHADNSPSLSIQPEQGYAHCFGCGYSALDPIAFVAGVRDAAYDDTARWLAEGWSIRVLDEATVAQVTAAHTR